ncbi:AMP-binding protein [Desulfosarcina sp. OttesenSCG-928-A07]|nr:AMP-binding protein [Desulfosarcina sp. OttesenSCG-928-A07]
MSGKLTYQAEMFKETFHHEFTYLNGFLRNVGRFKERTAVICPLRDQTWTYPQVNAECNRLAHALMADGVKKQDVVMYQLLNCAEFTFLYIAPQKLGAINCPINFRLSSGETAYILDDSKPKVYFYDSELSVVAEKALKAARHKPEKVVMVDVSGQAKPFAGAISYDDYVRGKSEANPDIVHPSTIYDETTRLYTSGTTGMPKGVPLNNINEILSAHDVLMHFPLSPFDRTLNMTPWFHRGGLYAGGPNPTFYAGASLVTLRSFDPEIVVDYVEKYGLTFMIGAPVTLKAICEEQQKKPRDFSRLGGVITMGSPLERKDCILFQKVLTPNIFNGYGSTEAFWNTFLRPQDLPEMAGSAGRSCTDDDMAVVNVYPDRLAEPGDVVPQDGETVGEVIVRAPGKCTYTYVNREAEAKAKFYKGWLYIGDLATWNDREFVTIVGRKDDMIISGGENIQPAQVEEIINENPQVEDCTITSVPHPKWGQLVVAYVVKRDPSLTVADLDLFCREHPMLASYKRPRYYRFVDSLDMTATGKKVHYKAKERAKVEFAEGLFEKASSL